MARVLYMTTGITGRVRSAVELANRLRERGHETVFASPSDCGGVVEAAGFDLIHLVADRELRQEFEDASDDTERRAIRARSLENSEIEDALERVSPDLLLIDVEMHVAIIVTRQAGIPTLIPLTWCSILPSRTNPPLHTGFTPEDGLRSHAVWIWLWFTRLKRLFSEHVRNLLNRSVPPPVMYDCRSRTDLAALASRRGWALRRHTTLFAWLKPHSYTDIEMVSFNAEELEFAPVRDSRLRHVGPMLSSRPPANPADSGDESAWLRFAGTRDPQRPLIYCSLGSHWDTDLKLISAVLEVFRRREGWDLVLGLGHKTAVDSFDDVPPNVLLLGWAPQFDVLRQAAVALTHGGISSVNECIANGVPMVGCSTNRVDQNGNVARIVFHGLGISVDRSRAGPDELEAAIETVLSDQGYKRRCEEMAREFERYRRDAIAENLIESRLAET